MRGLLRILLLFLGADVRQYSLAAAGHPSGGWVGHGVALGEVAHRRAQFAIGTAERTIFHSLLIVCLLGLPR